MAGAGVKADRTVAVPGLVLFGDCVVGVDAKAGAVIAIISVAVAEGAMVSGATIRTGGATLCALPGKAMVTTHRNASTTFFNMKPVFYFTFKIYSFTIDSSISCLPEATCTVPKPIA